MERSSTGSRTQGPSRRTVARGAAWSLPAVAVAAAAPAASASAPPVADSLYLAGPASTTLNTSVVYRVYGQADGDLGGQYPNGTTLTFPAGFVITAVIAGGGVQDGQKVTFPSGTTGGVRGYWTTSGNQTVIGTAPGLNPGSVTTTVS